MINRRDFQLKIVYCVSWKMAQIYRNPAEYSSDDPAKFAWSRLRKYLNIEFVTEALIAKHSIPATQRGNARKQATQIRYSLLQAREYFEAGQAVTLVTKPVLLYYSTMCLATAEILFKQPGDSSLDRARSEHRHHGLIQQISSTKSRSLRENASAVRAAPAVKNNANRIGTFELWHRTARMTPLYGVYTEHHAFGNTRSVRAFFGPNDQRSTPLPINGISLLECLRLIPSMRQSLSSFGIDSDLVRARLSVEKGNHVLAAGSEDLVFDLTIHPGSRAEIERAIQLIKFNPRGFEHIHVNEFPSGYGIAWTRDRTQLEPFGASLPDSFQESAARLFLLSRDLGLNEFGLYYVALFILGSYARYYPDYWLRAVEESWPLAIVAEELVKHSAERAPLLLAGEFESCVFLAQDP